MVILSKHVKSVVKRLTGIDTKLDEVSWLVNLINLVVCICVRFYAEEGVYIGSCNWSSIQVAYCHTPTDSLSLGL